jgi:integrase
MLQPVPHPVSGIYYLRRKVPAALRAALGREYKKSLKTRDPIEARIRFTAALAQSDEAFAHARAQNGGTEVVSRHDAQQIAARWFRAEQERMDQTSTFVGMLAQGSTTSVETSDGMEEVFSYEALGTVASADPDIDWRAVVHSSLGRAMRRERLPIPPKESTAYQGLFSAFEEHLHRLSAWALERQCGEHVPRGMGVAPWAPIDAQRKREANKPGEAGTLRDLFAVYAEDKTLTDGDTRATRRSIKAYSAIVESFIELHGDLPVVEISRAVIAQYRAALAKLPTRGKGIRSLTAARLIEKADREGLPRLTEPTIRNRLRAVSAVLSCGVRLGWAHENPVIASGAGRAAARAATRRQTNLARRNHYSSDELRAIFSSPIYSAAGWSPRKADFGRAWYWLPLLMYYTGARREELAQLVVSDVQHDAHAGWYLGILATADKGDDGMRGVKTVGSRRRIPLHPDLIARGFIGYVRSVPAEGQLFPQLRPDPAGYFGQNFGKRWAVYLREVVKLASPARPSHGFRHAFKTLCREVGIPEDVHDAITGHAGENGGVARGYGEMPLARMAEEIRRYPPAPSQPRHSENPKRATERGTDVAVVEP